MNPLAYATQPLLRSTLLGAGITDGELHRLRRAGTLVPIQRGAYLPAKNPGLNDARERHRFRVTAELSRVAPDAAVSHGSAAVLYGLPVWNVPLGLVHVTKVRRSGGRRTGRLYVHTAPLRPDEIETVCGKRVTSPARTVTDLARTLPFEPALVIADAALHAGLVTPGRACRRGARGH
jgi:predicted transcriptional regulator of viral defense system